jgi:protein-tyrosine kinase
MTTESISRPVDLAKIQRGRPAVATVLDSAAGAESRILPPNAGGPHGASYKLLRTQVMKRMDAMGANTLAILSAQPGEGKTQTAINLAIAIAAEQQRTALLVDFDLRNPGVHQRWGITPDVGVEDCLQSGRPLHEVIVRVRNYERLALLPARNAVANSSELLSAPRTARLLDELKTRYADRILIFDLPPVLLADDALAFSRLVQAGLMVVNEGRTSRDDLLRSFELLRDLPIVGTVLNGSRETTRPY